MKGAGSSRSERGTMRLNSVTGMYFSPTGATRKIIRGVMGGLDVSDVCEIDLTRKELRDKPVSPITSDLLVIGVPVYGMMIPKPIYRNIDLLWGNQTPAVIITVYGNVSKGYADIEIQSMLENRGFAVIAKANFVGEHSFSTDVAPLAKNRPNDDDLRQANDFGTRIKRALTNGGDIQALKFPMNRFVKTAGSAVCFLNKYVPQKSGFVFIKSPRADAAKCTACGACYAQCPTGAIDRQSLMIDTGKCIACFNCVRVCATKAREIRYRNAFLVRWFFALKNKPMRPETFFRT